MIELQDICARFGQFELKNISFHVPPGSYTVLLGPPGSGKTSIIELICGLRTRQKGRVLLAGKPVTHLDPAERQIAYVPQDYALFPSMTVFRNISFGLTVRRMRKAEIERLVRFEAERLGISHLLARRVAGLSGGERQRVALARALVLQSRILLLDEPVSALDEATRERVCLELRRLHDRLGMTTIHISHNFDETRMVADHVGVMNDGRLMQFGKTDDIFLRPVSAFVARFVRAGNILEARCESQGPGRSLMALGDQRVPVARALPQGPVGLLLRAEDMHVVLPSQAAAERVEGGHDGMCLIGGTVAAVYDPGGLVVNVKIELPGHAPMSAAVPAGQLPRALRPGLPVKLAFDPEKLHVLADGL